jgi:hypothetical protein
MSVLLAPGVNDYMREKKEQKYLATHPVEPKPLPDLTIDRSC